MKFDSDVYLEIVAIVQEGLVTMTDCSQKLRDIDLVERDGKLGLSPDYISTRQDKQEL